MFLSAGFLPEESQVFSLDAPLATVSLFSPERGDQRETLAMLAKRLVSAAPRTPLPVASTLSHTRTHALQVTFCVAMHEYPYVRFRATDPTACARLPQPPAGALLPPAGPDPRSRRRPTQATLR